MYRLKRTSYIELRISKSKNKNKSLFCERCLLYDAPGTTLKGAGWMVAPPPVDSPLLAGFSTGGGEESPNSTGQGIPR